MRFLFRRQIGIERLRLGRWPPAGGQMFDADHPDLPGLREGQRHAGAKREGGLSDMQPIDAELAARDDLGRQPARLEKPCVPEPLIDALGLGQEFLSFSPISACANGLSGSMRSFLGGRAWKLRPFWPPSLLWSGLPLPFGLPF